jgi:2-polyprenyl-3-methyl-5-hydroxy-6-metoxy-1,4-benzoquinol methylase
MNRENHIFPWWLGYLLLSPMRKLRDDPEAMLGPYLRPGMRMLDAGCAMGFFSLPMARMCGENARVVCVDVQGKMLEVLEKRARRAGLASRIETRVCSSESLQIADLCGQVDFALAYAVLHEARDPERFLRDIHQALSADGLLFFGEPSGPVSPSEFEEEISFIKQMGFVQTPSRHPGRPMSAVFGTNQGPKKGRA